MDQLVRRRQCHFEFIALLRGIGITMNKRFLFYRVAVILVSLGITILVIPRPGLALNMITMSPNDYLQVVFNEPVYWIGILPELFILAMVVGKYHLCYTLLVK